MHFIASYVNVSKSKHAIFSYCPVCHAERTIQFRDQRKYFAILKLPVYPVGETRETARCLYCKNEFTPEKIENAHQAYEVKVHEHLARLLCAFIKFHGLDGEDLFEQARQIFQESWEPPPNIMPSQVEAIFVDAVNESKETHADLDLISRLSDPIQLEDKNRLVQAAALILQAQAVPATRQSEWLFEFANALGMGIDQVAWIVERVTKLN